MLKRRLHPERNIKTGKYFYKTSIDLPDPLFRRAKATAAAKGQSLKTFISDSVEQSLNQEKQDWRAVLDNLPRVDDETTRQIVRTVDEWDDADLEFQRQQAKVEK